MEKSYNPFKMWGSWVGAVIGLLAYFLLGMLNPIGLLFVWIIGDIKSNDAVIASLLILILVLNIIIGFLIGWAVHSLIRKYKN